MIYQKVFKTPDGAQKRASFETHHCEDRYVFTVVRFLDGERDTGAFDAHTYQQPGRYTWRIERTSRLALKREREASRPRYARTQFRARA